MSEIARLESAIAALEGQRDTLGDAVVATATAPLRAKLRTLAEGGWTAAAAQRLKQVTILFTDLVGSTAMGQRLEPEDIHALMDGALERLTNVVEGHHGRVLQYAGDQLLAAFGSGDAHEEDPENAVRAGLAILEEARRLADEARAERGLDGFNVRVGINTGRVLLGGGVDADNSIRGIAVNIAARMEQTAPVGGLRVSHDTYRHVRGVFNVSEEPPIQVKGIDEPVRSYLVHGVKPRAFRVPSRGIDGVETRMIGRQAELDCLKAAFGAMYRDDAGAIGASAIAVIAEAGLGKSRLLYEFEIWTESRPEQFYLFKGRAQPQTRQQPYGLLRDLLAWRLRISDSDSAEVAQRKLCERVAPLFEADGEMSAHLLGHLIGLDYSQSPHLRGILGDPGQIRDRGFHAAAQVFRRVVAAENRPAILLLDDLHWADEESLDFLDYLLDANSDVRMLVVAPARPELCERRRGWPGEQSAWTVIRLTPLDRSESLQLAEALVERVGEVRGTLRDILAGGADGNPFFMEEFVKMLIDDGTIISDVGEWRIVRDKLITARVPPTLTGVLQARLDRLTQAERAVLQQASVIGYVFWDQALEAADDVVAYALKSLARRELIVRQATTSFVDAREFTFQHHLLRQVTYDSVLRDDRRRFHARAAAWLEERVGGRGGEYLGPTAEHYERAGELTTATDCYVRAAESAAARHGLDRTCDYVQRALALIPAGDQEVRWRLLAAREQILASQEDRAAHDADLDGLAAVADALDDDARRAEAGLRRTNALINVGDYPAAEDACKDALELARRAGAFDIEVRLSASLAFALRRMGDFPTARMVAERGLSLAQRLGDRQGEGELVSNLGGLATEQGELVAGAELYLRKLSISRELGDKAGETFALNTLGDNMMRLGDYGRARSWFDESLSLSREIGHRYGECIVLLNLAHVAQLQGDHDAAADCAQRSIDIAVTSHSRDLEAAALLPLGLAELERRNFAAARAALERSRDLFEDNAGPHLALEPVAGLAKLAQARGDSAEALLYATAILAHLDDGGTLDGTEEPLRIRLWCQQVLASVGDSRAAPMLETLHAELTTRAGRIRDRDARTLFLGGVPHHREILNAWRLANDPL